MANENFNDFTKRYYGEDDMDSTQIFKIDKKNAKKQKKSTNVSKKKKIKKDENNSKVDKKNKKGKGKKKKNTKRRKIIRIVLLSLLLIILIAAGVIFGMIYRIAQDARLGIEDLVIKYENSEVRDKDGNTIAVLSGEENRESIKLEEMAPYLPKAFVAIEDERFYEHDGIDLKRTIAATATYIFHKGESSFGGSTITQQLVKNLTSEKDRTWKRKVTEMARAYYIEKELSKDQILELYLNLIFMGGNTYGVEVASDYYFGKSARDLTLAECAFLAGINNTPNSYDPYSVDETERNNHLELIKVRTKVVLNKMNELGMIESKEEYDAAIQEVDAGLVFTKGTTAQSIYSYHTEAALNQIIDEMMEENDWSYEVARLHLFNSGYIIYTTQDTKIQDLMQAEAEKDRYQVTSSDGQNSQAGMVVIDNSNGYVVGVIGGLGQKTTSFGLNRGTQIKKQTGSSMKPLAVLAPGINSGIITAASVYDDIPFSYGGTNFKDYGAFRGLLTVRYAIESSQNIPMLKAMLDITPEASVAFLNTMGFEFTDSDKTLSLALGGLSEGTSPLKMAAAYATLANYGEYIEPTFYTKVTDSNGNVVREAHQERRTVMSKASAYIITSILTQVTRSGTATNCAIPGIQTAAKTGTTSADYDRWLCGYTPYYSAAAWYGYDYNCTVRGWGSNPAGQLWAAVMKPIHEPLENRSFERPDGITTAGVCRCSGKIATDACHEDPRGDMAYSELFTLGTVPSETCDCHVKVRICEDTGLLANDYCPHVVEKVFITRPNWETETGWQRATDAEYMLTIKDTCTIHTQGADTEKPEIKLKGSNNITVYLNSTYVDAGATAFDSRDGDLTSKIVVDNKVDTSKIGTYTVTYTVKDSNGNTATITRTVNVKKEGTSTASAPVITLNGDATMTVAINSTFVDPGATATDEQDGDLSTSIVVTGTVNTSIVGEYQLSYSVKNSYGKQATVTRKVIVTE